MTGPSAIGSENGKPTSIRSAPAAGSWGSRFVVVAMSGSPAVTNGRKALRPAALNRANVASTGFIGLVYRHSLAKPQAAIISAMSLVPTDLFVLPALGAVYLC